MADLTDLQAAQTIKIIGVDATGLETNTVDATTNGLKIDGSAVTQPISASSLPLPSGASTSANQTTEITALQLLDNVIGPVTPGTVAINSTLIGAQFNTALPTLTNTQQAAFQVDSSGRLIIRPLTSVDVVSAVQSGTWTFQQSDSSTSTYSASAAAFPLASAATDIFLIQGSATKTIKILRIEFAVTTTAGSGGLINAQWIRRSTANTGGTSIVSTKVSHDSTNGAATASVNHYTANPSALGTSIGTIRAIRAEAYNTSIAPTYTIWSFGDRPGQSVYLRGTGEYF